MRNRQLWQVAVARGVHNMICEPRVLLFICSERVYSDAFKGKSIKNKGVLRKTDQVQVCVLKTDQLQSVEKKKLVGFSNEHIH